jgi:hypothetical protein
MGMPAGGGSSWAHSHDSILALATFAVPGRVKVVATSMP